MSGRARSRSQPCHLDQRHCAARPHRRTISRHRSSIPSSPGQPSRTKTSSSPHSPRPRSCSPPPPSASSPIAHSSSPALGPTAYELVETPTRPSARPYNILVGHSLAILAAFLALALTHAAATPPVNLNGGLSTPRIEAAILAAALTVLATLAARAMQPAAVSTTLLLALGSLKGWHDAALVLAGVLLITVLGEPIRRWRLRSSPTYTEAAFTRNHP